MKKKVDPSPKQEITRLCASLLTFVAASALFFWLAYATLQVKASSNQKLPEISFQAIQSNDPVLLYGANDNSALTVARISKNVVNGKAQWKIDSPNPIPLFGEFGLKVSNMIASPDGKFVALEIYNEVSPTTWILNLRSGRMYPALSEGYSQLLGWHPDSKNLILKVMDVGVVDSGLWVIDIHTGKYTRIEIPNLPPEGLLDAAISPDGNLIAYAYSQGLGFGSEMWLMDLSNGATQQIRADEYGIVAHILWSPDGSQIAFSALLDSPMPYQQGGLWIVNADGSDIELLSTAIDGGHGQEPIFSADGQMIYFVERKNPENKDANYDPDALVSSIHAFNLATHQINELVATEGAKQVDISLSTEGNIVFVSNRNKGASEIWMLDNSGKLQQITSDGQNKHHPLIVSP